MTEPETLRDARARVRERNTTAHATLAKVPAKVLAQHWTDEELESAKRTLLAALEATKPFYDKDTKTYIEVPDHMARISAANSICNQAVGLPVQRIVRQDLPPIKDRQQELIDLAMTPTGRALLLKIGAISEEWLAKHLPSDPARTGDRLSEPAKAYEETAN